MDTVLRQFRSSLWRGDRSSDTPNPLLVSRAGFGDYIKLWSMKAHLCSAVIRSRLCMKSVTIVPSEGWTHFFTRPYTLSKLTKAKVYDVLKESLIPIYAMDFSSFLSFPRSSAPRLNETLCNSSTFEPNRKVGSRYEIEKSIIIYLRTGRLWDAILLNGAYKNPRRVERISYLCHNKEELGKYYRSIFLTGASLVSLFTR